MRWVVLIVALLAAFVIAVFAAGAMLPEKHTVTREITVQRPVTEVWAVLTDHAGDPSWRPDVASVRRIADRDGKPVWEELYKNDDSMRIATISVEPMKRMERKIVDQSAFGGVWVYELTPSGDGKATTIRITENGETYNGAFRLIGRFVIGFETTVETYLINLGARFGQKVEFK